MRHTFSYLYKLYLIHHFKGSPREEDALHHLEVLQQHISLRFLA